MTIRRGTFDGREFDAGPTDRAEVVIIGAGPSGATVAKYLTGFGFHVVCLEQGGWVSNTEFTGNRDEHELSLFGRWHKNPNVRQLPEDYPTEESGSDVTPVMYNAVGGGSIHFGGMWPRFTPSDFRLRTLHGIADDWPFTWEDLAPHYDANDIDFACSGLAGDPAFPPMPAPRMPAHPINDYGRKFALGMNAMGWHWWPAPNAISSQSTRGLAPCVRYGVCESGCPNGSKASVDLTHWPRALANGATLVTGARVRQIEVDQQGRADAVIFLDGDGREHRLRCEVLILAANGIGTARLLQLSAGPRFPDGLANSSGLVGRRLMMNPTAMVVGVFDEPLHSWRGVAGQNVHSFEFYENDPTRGHLLGGSWCTMPSGGPYAASELAAEGGHPAYGAGLTESVRRVLGHSMLVCVVTNDLPDEDNRVTLDPQLRDSSGIPAPRVTYRQDQNNRDLIAFHLQRASEALLAAGAVETIEIGSMPDQPGHLLGTARMGADPSSSVVDGFGRSHDVPNLFVVDGSVFVTAGGVSPTSTISAIARRCAAQMVAMASEQETP